MCHTRELAFQISKEYERFSKFLQNIKVGVFFGGMAIAKDEQVRIIAVKTYLFHLLSPGYQEQLSSHCSWNSWSHPRPGQEQEAESEESETLCSGRVRQDAGAAGHEERRPGKIAR